MNSLVTRGSLFDDFFKDIAPGFYVRPLHGDGVPTPSQIKVDVKETDGGYTVQAEVPGVPKEDIHVSIDGNVVSLRAEVRQHDQKTEGEKVRVPSAISARWRAVFSCPSMWMPRRPRPNTTTAC